MTTYATLTPHNGHDVHIALHATTGVVTLMCRTCDEPVIHAARTKPDTRYALLFRRDDSPVDIGDWLPQTREHYERVGPFQHRDTGKNLTWQEWWADDRNHVDNWESFGAVLMVWCDDCKRMTDTDEALWGLDFCILDSDWSPTDGDRMDVAVPEIADNPWLHSVATDLIAQYEHERNKA